MFLVLLPVELDTVLQLIRSIRFDSAVLDGVVLGGAVLGGESSAIEFGYSEEA